MNKRRSQATSPASALRGAFGAAVLPGKQAMEGRDRKKVSTGGQARVECSLYLDEHLEPQEPNSRRWDYVLVVDGASQRPVAVEVHPATASEVKVILEKQGWAIKVLDERCPGLRIAVRDWHWVASGKVFLRPTDPQLRRLRQSGIQGPQERLVLG